MADNLAEELKRRRWNDAALRTRPGQRWRAAGGDDNDGGLGSQNAWGMGSRGYLNHLLYGQMIFGLKEPRNVILGVIRTFGVLG
ncbi:MAG: hypothetical protein WCE61_01135 [Candidatus Acidiferrum sp.]